MHYDSNPPKGYTPEQMRKAVSGLDDYKDRHVIKRVRDDADKLEAKQKKASDLDHRRSEAKERKKK